MQGVSLMKIFFYFTLVLGLFALSGCATKKEISQSESYLISVKNKQIALSDTGFINQGKAYTNVQIFSMGNVLFNLEVMPDEICLDGRCLDPLAFNGYFFQSEHYVSLMQDIITKMPIYSAQNLQKTSSGFEQEIELEKSHIIYKVEGQNVLFRDTKQGIMIRLKPLL